MVDAQYDNLYRDFIASYGDGIEARLGLLPSDVSRDATPIGSGILLSTLPGD